jgi:two-component system, NarL family, response regulator DegU
VMKLIAQYKTSQEIADELFISVRTVDRHRANIADKLDLKGTHALLQFALEHKFEL